MEYSDFFTRLQERRAAPTSSSVKFGLVDLDQYLTGLESGSVTMLSSRPLMGKTSLCLSMSRSAAKQGQPVAFFSNQNKLIDLKKSLLVQESGIEFEKINTLNLDTREAERLKEAASSLSKLDLEVEYLEDSRFPSLNAKLNALKKGTLVFVDCIDFVSLADLKKSDFYEPEILLHQLRKTAVQAGLNIVATSVSAKTDDRYGTRPFLNHLRNGYSAVADVVLFLHRRDYYDPLDKPGQALIVVSKNRYGNEGDVTLFYQKGLGLFKDFRLEEL